MTDILNTILNQIFIQFTFQLGSCIVPFLIGKERRSHFWLRFVTGSCLFMAGNVLVSRQMYPALATNTVLALFYYPIVAALFYFVIFFAFDVGSLEALIVVTGGYATEHIAYAAGLIVQYVLREEAGITAETTSSLLFTVVFRYLIYVPVAVLVYRLIIRRNQREENYQGSDRKLVMISVLALLVAVILSVFYSQADDSPQARFLGNVICPLYGISCCLLILLVQYDVLRENRLEEEKKTMDQLLQMAKMQQQSSREAIDIINIKCHDLKHQIRQLTHVADEGERSRYVSEINSAINIYDATYHTGCESLDYVLREKTLIAQENNVAFSCMADGSCINHMDPPDVYALMGNALDNALEREKQEAESERSMSLSIWPKGAMALIHLENRCSSTPLFRDGLPQTDKQDKTRHGFGVRSIRMIAHKYGGEVEMAVRDGNFVLNIMLPMKPA